MNFPSLSGLENTGTFYFQNILFSNEINHRVLQNENGPCPLLALINAMLLRGRFSMATGTLQGKFPISFKALTDCLRRELENISQRLMEENTETSNTKIIQIAQCFELFPTLEKGLDINIKFTDVQAFDMEELAHQFFDIYDLNIYHCWVIDPDGIYGKIHHLIADKTYDQVQDMLLNNSINNNISEWNDDDIYLINKFFQNNKQQRTKYGVHKLYKRMKESEIATLFHNNHYSTIYKHNDDHIIYELVTDVGIVDEKQSIIWKTFNPSNYIDGIDEIFVDSNFNVVNKNDKSQLDKLRKIMHHLRKYKYDINILIEEKENNYINYIKKENIIVKKIENTIEFITKFPLNPLECKPIFDDSKKKDIQSKDDLSTNYIEMELKLGPKPMTRALSDTITNTLGSIISHNNKEIRYNIRQCRVNDIQYICNKLNFKDEIFWAKEFLTNNTKRNGYVLEDNKTNIIGFILYERCEPLITANINTVNTAGILVRDLSIGISNDIDVDCKWRVSDWKQLTNKNKKTKKVTFYSQFILITDIVIHEKYRKKGYGSKLLQTIIYSFPFGTPFAAQIKIGNDSAVHCFGKCGFIISRNEKGYFYMTLISDYNKNDIEIFKKSSILKKEINNNILKDIIKELKDSQNIITNIMIEEEEEDDDDEDIFIQQQQQQDKKNDEEEEKYKSEEEFDPEKLNRLLAELCCMDDNRLTNVVLTIISKFINNNNNNNKNINFNDIINDFEQSLINPFNIDNNDNDNDINNKYIKLAFDVLYCCGFIKKKNERDNIYYLTFESDDLWRLEAAQELIVQYQLHNTKQQRTEMLKSIVFDSNPTKYWKHIFDSDVHGKDTRDKTLRILKKICNGIIKNENNLTHKTRNLNYQLLMDKFKCEIPLLLLQKYGFEQRQDLYKKEIRLIYKYKNIEQIKKMLSKIEYEEKIQKDTDIFSNMDQQMQVLWLHCLTDTHGENVRKTTINTLTKICKNIINNPFDTNARNLDIISLQNKFHCQIPLELLQENGFKKQYDNWHGLRLTYNSSDITPIKNMLNVLENSNNFDLNNANKMLPSYISADHLRLIVALKKAQNSINDPNTQHSETLLNLLEFKQSLLDNNNNNNNSIDISMSSLFDNNNNNNKMNYIEMTNFLQNIDMKLSRYAGSFISNGIATKKQLINLDITFVDAIIDNKNDSNTFKNWLSQYKSNNDNNISGI